MADKLLNAVSENRRLIRERNVDPPEYSVRYPLSSSFLTTHGVEQMQSGQSVVLVNVREQKLYKYPMLYRDVAANLLIRHRLLGDLPSLERSALPLSQRTFGKRDYFEYNLYDQPLSEQEIRHHMVWFVDEVVQAVSELHDQANLAHLDIRLDNICVDSNRGQVILVDLDRSRNIETGVGSVIELYSNDEMYNPPVGSGTSTWSVSNLDWRQVGLMMKNRICSTDHEFITKLIEEGMLLSYPRTQAPPVKGGDLVSTACACATFARNVMHPLL